MHFIFSISIFLGSSLLFMIQPMVAKNLLPVYGGTPTVWTLCMLFFQCLLLCSYAYVYVLGLLRHHVTWRGLHFFIMAASLWFVPLAFVAHTDFVHPEWGIFSSLVIQLGVPLLVLGASAPLLQFAYSQTNFSRAVDPYFLYSASNMGSLIALLAYPGLIEYMSGLQQQYKLWSAGYGMYLTLLAVILWGNSYTKSSQAKSTTELTNLTVTKILSWITLSFLPCSLMLGVTFYISTDLAPTPLLWILPLTLYLLSFIVTFAKRPIISHTWVVNNVLFVLIIPILTFAINTHKIFSWQTAIAHLAGFFMLALLCNGELVKRRPSAQHLPLFYFCMSIGGTLAGIFNSIVAPRIFTGFYEYPLLLALSLLALPLQSKKGGLWVPLLVVAVLSGNNMLADVTWANYIKSSHIAVIAALAIIVYWQYSTRILTSSILLLFVFTLNPWAQEHTLLASLRNFYGIKQVSAINKAHILTSNTTLHGAQFFSLSHKEQGKSSYYGAIADVIDAFRAQHLQLHASLLGMGTGTLLCQFRNQDILTVA